MVSLGCLLMVCMQSRKIDESIFQISLFSLLFFLLWSGKNPLISEMVREKSGNFIVKFSWQLFAVT